jgi:hypothetical protein
VWLRLHLNVGFMKYSNTKDYCLLVPLGWAIGNQCIDRKLLVIEFDQMGVSQTRA